MTNTIPQQQNGYDCGVYVCKYADAMKKTSFQATEHSSCIQQITQSTHFKFNQRNITHLRKEIQQIISKLAQPTGGIYIQTPSTKQHKV